MVNKETILIESSNSSVIKCSSVGTDSLSEEKSDSIHQLLYSLLVKKNATKQGILSLVSQLAACSKEPLSAECIYATATKSRNSILGGI